MTFEVSGISEKGRNRYILTIVMFLIFGSIYLLVDLVRHGFTIITLFIVILLVLITILIGYYARNASKKKTIIIEEGLFSYFIDGKPITVFHLKEITKISTSSFAKDRRDGFIVWKGDEIIWNCGGLTDLDPMKLTLAFNEILTYKEEYGFDVDDPLKWEGKKDLTLSDKI